MKKFKVRVVLEDEVIVEDEDVEEARRELRRLGCTDRLYNILSNYLVPGLIISDVSWEEFDA